MKYIKIITLGLGIVILSGLAFVGVANAQSFKAGNMVTVAANETVDSMLFAGGNNIDIAGTVKGDVYCTGQTITISGTVQGDVFCAGQTIIVSGDIEGSVRLAGQSITISGIIGNSATIGAQNLIIDKTGIIGRDLLGGSQNITVNGAITRDIVTGSQNITINGTVGRNIKGDVETIAVGSAGFINGDIEYIGLNDPIISVGGSITGTVNRTAPQKDQQTKYFAPMAFSIGWFIYVLFAFLILALVLAGLFPHILNESAAAAIKNPGKTFLVGATAAVMIPVIIVTLLITVIGVPIAMLTLLLWFILMIISGPFAGYLLGRTLLKGKQEPVWLMLSGASIIILLHFVPFIGFVSMLASYIFGTGMILMQSKKLLVRTSTRK